ncbi:protein REPRESSOR OF VERNALIZATION 1-like [Silene latifolia]|uniref:protein REPRESSOR OF VERNALIZATION 1-like n=1 Tax=Silene latifolia TaxID=37657 RepID=UPI003D782456
MGVCARDDRKSTVARETMVGIRVSDKIMRHNDDSTSTTTSTPLDQDNPNKKMKFLHEIDDLNHRQSSICSDTNVEDQSDDDDEEEEDDDNDDDAEEESENGAEPIGDVVKVSDDGGERRNHFSAFQFDGMVFHLEDTVLVAPEEGIVKPSVAIIKDIFLAESGSLQVCCRRFYRPEEAEKMEGGTWESHDARELFCSSYLDDLDASTVMHKCIIHLVPHGRTLPDRKQQPGFIVQKFYDFGTKKIRNLSERDCEGILLLQPEAV